MKKFTIFLLLATIAHFSFAIPNIKLYENGEIYGWIENNNIYTEKGLLLTIDSKGKLHTPDGDNVATITEKDNRIIIDSLIDGIKGHKEYNKTSGFLLQYREIAQYKESDILEEYDEETGLLIKFTYFKNNIIDHYSTYKYNNGKTSLITYFNSDGTLESVEKFFYNKKSGNIEKIEERDSNDNLKELLEYDPKKDLLKSSTRYDQNGSIKDKTLYNDRYEPIERLVYLPNSKKPEKWTFINFNEEGKYLLSENIYLDAYFSGWFSEHEAEEATRSTANGTKEWNDNYNYIVRKHVFTENDKDYKYIEDLKNKHYLISEPFTLCNKESLFYYYFIPNDNDEIDYTKCYEIELIKRKMNYPALNKSGKNKGPFGFDIGMTYNEVKEACGGTEPEHISDDRYWVKPKKSHPLFEKYIVWISDSVGLYYVKGISKEIHTSEYGNEVKDEFNDLVKTLEKKYGKFSKDNKVKPDYYWKDERNWTKSIKDGARDFSASWATDINNYNDFDGLTCIGTGVGAYSLDKTYIWIEYGFQNYNAAKEAIDDVL